MYHQHFGLREPPFSIAVNPRYLFMSPRHRDALAHLLYGVSSGGGFILLTGEVGTGKTTVNRCLLEQLPATTDVAIILNPALSANELLASACDELAITYPDTDATLKQLTDALHRFLLANHAAGRRTVLMIDEAQHLDFDVLEQIRLLTNLETNDEKLLQIILIGQPELSDKLSRPELRQLNQRITARYHLEPLDADETSAYIRHRLEIAGLQSRHVLFSSAVIKDIHRRTRGIPRLINLLCDRALLGAYGQRRDRVDRQLVSQAAVEVLGEKSIVRPDWQKRVAALAFVALAGLVGVAVGALTMGGDESWGPVINVTPSGEAAVNDPEATASEEGAVWLLPKTEAYAMLWRLASDAPQPATLCAGGEAAATGCIVMQAETWEPLVALQRPVLLSMRRSDRFAAATVVLRFQQDRADVLTEQGLASVPLIELAPFWTGEAAYLWRHPQGWTSPLSLGDRSSTVAAVAQLFATLDGQQQPLAVERFNAALERRVRLFQGEQGLVEDGVIGVQTMLSLNRALSIALDTDVAQRRLSLLTESN